MLVISAYDTTAREVFDFAPVFEGTANARQ